MESCAFFKTIKIKNSNVFIFYDYKNIYIWFMIKEIYFMKYHYKMRLHT